jgi:hypothetical protein
MNKIIKNWLKEKFREEIELEMWEKLFNERNNKNKLKIYENRDGMVYEVKIGFKK